MLCTDAFQIFFVVVAYFGFGFSPFWIYLSSLHLPVQSTSSPWLVTALRSTCVSISVLCSAGKPQSTFSVLLSQMHVDVHYGGKCRTGADCLQMPSSLPIAWGKQKSWNNCVGCKANCWWFTSDCVRVLLCFSFSTSVGNRIQFADLLKGVWSISSPEIVWALSFQTYCYLSLSVVETVLWGYNRISISKMYGFASSFIF